MKPIQGYDLVTEAGEFKQIPPGIYGVRITKVVDNPNNEYLEVYCDIVRGEYANYFKSLTDAGLNDSSRTFRSYKQNALPFFKAFITAVEKTNPGYHWDWDEQKLVGKNVMAVFGEEEFVGNDGTVKVNCRIQEFRSLEAFQEGKIKVPELKKLPADQVPAPQAKEPEVLTEVPDIELPF